MRTLLVLSAIALLPSPAAGQALTPGTWVTTELADPFDESKRGLVVRLVSDSVGGFTTTLATQPILLVVECRDDGKVRAAFLTIVPPVVNYGITIFHSLKTKVSLRFSDGTVWRDRGFEAQTDGALARILVDNGDGKFLEHLVGSSSLLFSYPAETDENPLAYFTLPSDTKDRVDAVSAFCGSVRKTLPSGTPNPFGGQ